MEHCIEGNVAELKPCIACDEATIGINDGFRSEVIRIMTPCRSSYMYPNFVCLRLTSEYP